MNHRNEGVSPLVEASVLGDLITRDEEPAPIVRHRSRRRAAGTLCGAPRAEGEMIVSHDGSVTCEACRAAMRVLTPAQVSALRQLAASTDPRSAFDFGSTTISKLRRLGYIARGGHPYPGIVITDTGRAALASTGAR